MLPFRLLKRSRDDIPAQINPYTVGATEDMQDRKRRRKPNSDSLADLTGQITRQGTHPVAKGGFGDIWRCTWNVPESNSIEVAVKVITAQFSADEDREKKDKRLRREIKVWKRLNHKNILPLYGVTSDFGPFVSMVCPWVEHGSLSHFLGSYHTHLTLGERFELLCDIAAGLSYLHSCSVIHGDLTGSNVLIDRDRKACLADFGLSIVLLEFEGTSYITSSITPAIRWAAPELFALSDNVLDDQDSPPCLPTTESDIYSFGSVMLQVLSGSIPYRHIRKDAQVLLAIYKGDTPMRPCTPEIRDLHWTFIQRCWSEPSRVMLRPSAEEVVEFCAIGARAHQLPSSHYKLLRQCERRVGNMKIYQSLVLYTFLHLESCVKDQGLLASFKDLVNVWKEWDIIRCLTHHQAIRSGCLALLFESKELCVLCKSHLDDEVDGSKMLELDAQVIAHQLASLLYSPDPNVRTYADVVFALKNQEAQSMVDLLQALLENPIIDCDLKILFADALVELVTQSLCYPSCLVLNDIKMDSDGPVASGAFGDIYKGYIKGRLIAMKQLRRNGFRPEPWELEAREGIIWSRLSHPNLLPFYGISYMDADSSRICFVSPWIEHGHIGQYLEKFPQTDRNPLVMDIAQGIEYLHTCLPAVIHGDIKPPNILITPSGTACLADFGLSYARDPLRRVATSSQGPGGMGTFLYMPPERILLDGEATFAGDIYAFACVLYELFSGKPPFYSPTMAGYIRALKANEPPPKPAETSEPMWGLIRSCLHRDPLQRPSASNVVRRLRSFVGVDEQRRQHQWDDDFRMTIRRTYSLTDHPLSHLAAPS